MNHGQNRGSKSRKLSQEKCSLNENIGKFRNFAEIGRAEFRTYVEIWGSICKMHHWLRKLDALYIPRYIHAYMRTYCMQLSVCLYTCIGFLRKEMSGEMS